MTQEDQPQDGPAARRVWMGECRPSEADARQNAILSVRLWPHRSLSPRGFRILIVVLASIAVASGLLFISIGAWPVFGFFGLDILGLIWAFRASYRQARAFEEIRVTREEVLLRRVSSRGVAQEWRFNPLWSKLQIRRDNQDRVVELAILSRGESLPFAAFLGPGEKEEFSQVIGAALAEARG